MPLEPNQPNEQRFTVTLFAANGEPLRIYTHAFYAQSVGAVEVLRWATKEETPLGGGKQYKLVAVLVGTVLIEAEEE